MATELKQIVVEIKECQFVKNPYQSEQVDSEEEDDDDFEEEDDEDDKKPKTTNKVSKLKISSVAKLACSMREMINNKIKDANEEVVRTAILKIKDYTSPATKNVWYMFLELEYSF